MGQQRRSFTPEFKQEAVDLVRRSGTLLAAQALCRTARLKATANLTRFMVFTSRLRGIPCSCREALGSQAVSKMSGETTSVSKTFIEVDLKRAGNQGVFCRLFISS
jgi:hypothetical protein